MSGRMTFFFDAGACSGCKACVIACKDRHGTADGLLWRRVSEVAGGSWERAGSGWRNDVFAYHLSISCNHCELPICQEGCPAHAISRRSDGVVKIDPERCLGCGYCSWVCPYGSPQFDGARGVMTKCTFCDEDLDAGFEPACVAACPVRALDAGDADELAARHGAPTEAASIPPLPAADLTRPALHLAPHAQAERSRGPDVELTPRPPRGLREWSLVAFTLLSQTAAGLILFTAVLRAGVFGAFDMERYDPVLLPAAAGCLALALVVSALHLGRPERAWRAASNLRTSWLSREILLALVLLGTTVLAWQPGWPAARWAAPAAAVFFVGGMASVYRQRTVPVWNRWRTPYAFFSSAVLLGGLTGLAIVVGMDWPAIDPWRGGLVALLLLVEIIVQLRQRRLYYSRYERLGV